MTAAVIKFANLDQFSRTGTAVLVETTSAKADRVRDAEREAELALTRCSELQQREWLERAPHDVLWLAQEVRMLRALLEEAEEESVRLSVELAKCREEQ